MSFRVRVAQPTDVPALMRLKRLLAESENSLNAVRATAADWLRDGFGPEYRKRGVARALVARVAALAHDLGSPIVELTVRADNPAQDFYQRSGFENLPHCLTYVLGGPALAALAKRDKDDFALAG